MTEYANTSKRLGRAVGAACILLAGTVPLGIALLAAIGAALSDNPNAYGPGDAAFLFMLGCTALAARVAREPALRRDLGRWWFGALVLGLVAVYPAVTIASISALRGLDRSPAGRRGPIIA
jgi:hypothetical protein